MVRHVKDLRFRASAAAYRWEPAVAAEYLVLAEHSDGGGRTVEVQRSLAAAPDDGRSLGVDGHCLVIDGGPTSYRCVERWTVVDSVFVFGLTPAGSAELGVTTIRIDVPTDAVAATASALHRVIDNGPPVDVFTVVRTPYLPISRPVVLCQRFRQARGARFGQSVGLAECSDHGASTPESATLNR